MTAAPRELGHRRTAGPLKCAGSLPGQLDAAVAGWFGRFPAETDSREDTYLVNPAWRGLSVKVRAGRALEMKMYHGTAGMLDVPGRARGRIQSWQKWSFPVGPLSQDGDAPAGWTVIRKSRRISRFRLAREGIVAGSRGGPASQGARWNSPRSARATRPGGPWDSRRPVRPICSAMCSRAPPTLIFAQALPGGAELGPGDCRSYAEWLSCTTCHR